MNWSSISTYFLSINIGFQVYRLMFGTFQLRSIECFRSDEFRGNFKDVRSCGGFKILFNLITICLVWFKRHLREKLPYIHEKCEFTDVRARETSMIIFMLVHANFWQHLPYGKRCNFRSLKIWFDFYRRENGKKNSTLNPMNSMKVY